MTNIPAVSVLWKLEVNAAPCGPGILLPW